MLTSSSDVFVRSSDAVTVYNGVIIATSYVYANFAISSHTFSTTGTPCSKFLFRVCITRSPGKLTVLLSNETDR